MDQSGIHIYEDTPPPTWADIWHTIPEPCFVVDRHMRLVRITAPFCELVGRSEDELRGNRLDDVAPTWMLPIATRLLEEAPSERDVSGEMVRPAGPHGGAYRLRLQVRGLLHGNFFNGALCMLTPLQPPQGNKGSHEVTCPSPSWAEEVLDLVDHVFLWRYDARTQRVLRITGGAYRMLGHPLATWMEPEHDGFPFLADSCRSRFVQAVHATQVLGIPQTLEHDMRTIDGHIIPVATTLRTDNRAGSGTGSLLGVSLSLASIHTARKSPTDERMESCLTLLREQLLAEIPMTEIVADTTHHIAETLHVEWVEVAQRHAADDRIRLRASGGPSMRRSGDTGRTPESLPLPHDGLHATTLRSRMPLFMPDFSQEGRFTIPEYLHHLGVTNGVSLPIVGKERTWGILGVYSSSPRNLNQGEVQFLLSTARLLATGWEHEEQKAGHQKHIQSLEVNYEVAVFGSHELNNLLSAMHLQLQLLGHERGTLSRDERLERVRSSFTRQLARLRSFSEVMVEVSRLHANRLSLARSHVDLARLTRETVTNHAQRTRIPLQLKVDASPTGQWDRKRLGLMLDRLLRCAVSLRPTGPISIGVCEEHERGLVGVRIPGASIPVEQLSTLHNLHAVLPDRRQTALALDLFLIQTLATLHGGRFDMAEHNPGEVYLSLSLPCETTSPQAER